GHAELFATDQSGTGWHNPYNAATKAWTGWSSLGGSLTSRPVPVRWADGHVDAFARGSDGQLQWARWATSWQPFAAVSAGTQIIGEPSVISNPAGGGGVVGPEVFARDTQATVM